MPSFGSEDPLFPETDSAKVSHKKENAMATIMPASELVRRAAAWLAEQRALYPEKSLAVLLDEAGMRFNLNPLDAAALGLTGQALADYLRQNGMECEYADPRYLVLMFTPENPVEDIARLEAALAELCAGGIPPAEPPAEHREAFCALARQAEPRLTVRQAVFVPQETIPAGSALGRVCALPTVSCPPAIPIVVSGEVIGPAALELFAAYGVETVSVVKPEKL